MSIYKIKLINNSRNGFLTEFTLYSAAPAVSSGWLPVQVWSNSFLSKKVNSDGGIWSIAINDAPLAVCGTSTTQELGPDTQISATMAPPATLGSDHGPGSTHLLYNDEGSPAFQEHEDYTAPSGAYKIQTANDFSSNLNFVAGYGWSDSRNAVPVATFSVDVNTNYTITPSPKPRLFIAAFKSTPGQLIDSNPIMERAEIDFSAHPGQPNAIVTLTEDGFYQVEYMTQALFAMKAASPVLDSQNSSVQLTQLKHQVKIMADLIDTALGISRSAGSPEGDTSVGTLQHDDVKLPVLLPDYLCQVDWLEGPNEETKQNIADLLRISMTRLKFYTFEPVIDEKSLSLPVWHVGRPSVEFVLAAWLKACKDLDPKFLGNFITNRRVDGIVRDLGQDATTADNQVSATIYPPVDPAYVFSLPWKNNPSLLTKSIITSRLVTAMREKGYTSSIPNVGGDQLSVIMSHKRPSNLQTATKDWIDAWRSLGPERIYTGFPKCEPAITIAGDVPPPTILPVPNPAYYCSLDWLEGPGPLVKLDIMIKLAKFMMGRGYVVGEPRSTEEKVTFYFSHDFPSDLPTATQDWIAAWKSLEFQRMYTTNPQTEHAFTIRAGNVSLSELKLDEAAVAARTNGTNGTTSVDTLDGTANGSLVGDQAPAAPQSQPVAPEVQTFSSVASESIEEKKRRALALLQAEGLVGFGGIVGA